MARRLVLLLLVLSTLPAAAQRLLPWQSWILQPTVRESTSLDSLFDLPWASTGGPEGVLAISEGKGPWGGRYFEFKVKIDHTVNGKSWPAFETQPSPPLEFGGYDALRYWIRCDSDLDREIQIRFILHSAHNYKNEELPRFRPGQWVQVTHFIHDRREKEPHKSDLVTRLHFFLCEDQYADGDEMTFRIGGFELVKLEKTPSRLGAGQAALGLWVGERGDSSNEAVILDAGTARLPALAWIEAGEGVVLRADDELHVRFHEVFSGRESRQSLALGRDVPAGEIVRLTADLKTSTLPPGYYLVTADVRREGNSLLGGRVGCDDLYLRAPRESMTHVVLSIRTGMARWVHEPLFGDLQGRTRIALPHVYDPLNMDTYQSFIHLFSFGTGTHTEGNEAGDTGLVLAAEAFRKSGEHVRTAFVEDLFEKSFNHMIARHQAPNGGVVMESNDPGYLWSGREIPKPSSPYDSNQMGEFIRPMAYAMIYYRNYPEKLDYARKLDAACRKTADYLAAHSVQDSDGLAKVIRHLTLKERPDGSVEQVTYYQEGRQCDVYLGRAFSGLTYYAYATQLYGRKVPDEWWEIIDNTVEWTLRKMKPNGWFDWQCGDTVEGGCHTFLGNIYIGEGLFGAYLANRSAGRAEQAKKAAEATRRAYRYVTDDCWIKGVKYEYPLDFWVGPYVYWLFTQYLDTVGPEPKLQEWLTVIDRRWTVERGWRDFLQRPAADKPVGRSETNGALELAILGYLGIKQMEEIGKPLHWEP